MKTRGHSLWLAVALSMVLAGCNEAEKKAAEAKAAAEAQAAELAQKAKAEEAKAKEAAEKAKAELATQLDTQKTALGKTLTDGLAAMEAKVTPLKEKAGKLKGAAKKKAEPVLAAWDAAKAKLADLEGQVKAAAEAPALADLTAKTTAAMDEAQKALDAVEAAISPPKKKK